MDSTHQVADVAKFMLAGNSTFTLHNMISNARITYKVRQAEAKEDGEEKPNFFFVSYLNGPDNWTNYEYIGIIDNNGFCTTKKTRVSEDAPSLKGFKWLYRHMTNISQPMEVCHEGKCGRCGRKLTVPESIKSGFGPECINHV